MSNDKTHLQLLKLTAAVKNELEHVPIAWLGLKIPSLAPGRENTSMRLTERFLPFMVAQEKHTIDKSGWLHSRQLTSQPKNYHTAAGITR